jgi:hypothetical protein
LVSARTNAMDPLLMVPRKIGPDTLLVSNVLRNVEAFIDPARPHVLGSSRFFDGADTSPADSFADNFLWRDSNATFNPGDNSFICGGWHRTNSSTRSQHLIGKGGVNNLTASYFLVQQRASPNYYQWTVYSTPVSVLASVTTLAQLGGSDYDKWHFIVCYHDSVNDRIGIYLNGVRGPTANHATGIYSADTAYKFVIGANGRMSGGNSQPTEWTTGNCARVFTCMPNVPAEEVVREITLTLYNEGKGLGWSELLAKTTEAQRTRWGFIATKGSYYNLSEVSGVGTESIAGLNMTDKAGAGVTSTQGPGPTDAGPVFRVVDKVGGKNYEQTVHANRPIWNVAGSILSKPSMTFDGVSDGLVYTAADAYDFSQGLIAIVFRYPNVLTGSNKTLIEFSDIASDTKFFKIQLLVASKKVSLHTTGTVNNSITFDSLVTAPNIDYAIAITGNGSAYNMFYSRSLTASTRSVVLGTNNGAWINNVTGKDVTTVGMGQGLSGPRNWFEGQISELIVSSNANVGAAQPLVDIF